MENRNSEEAPSVPFRRRQPYARCAFVFAILTGCIFLACASPSDPVERKPPVPLAVKDLAAAQSEGDVMLTFTLPKDTVDRRPLAELPTIEIYRTETEETGASGGTAPKSGSRPTLLVTIPSAMASQYSSQGTFRYAYPLTASDFAGKNEQTISYLVRARASEKRESADSNTATVNVYAAAKPIDDLKADVTEAAVVLTWSPPRQSLAETAPAITGYKVYRTSAEPGATASSGRAKTAPAEIGDTPAGSTTFSDTNFEFGSNYVYDVRSTVATPIGALESGDSNAVALTPKDVFAPAPPRGLEVVFVPAQGDVAAHLELSWAISPETDLAGYNVYRSDDENISGTRQSNELLPTPAFRDMNVESGHRYFYTVTAVDRSGNESPRSGIVSGSVQAANQTAP